MNKFELRNLHSTAKKKEKRMSFFRSLIKSVNVGANGTQNYVCLLYTSDAADE